MLIDSEFNDISVPVIVPAAFKILLDVKSLIASPAAPPPLPAAAPALTVKWFSIFESIVTVVPALTDVVTARSILLSDTASP